MSNTVITAEQHLSKQHLLSDALEALSETTDVRGIVAQLKPMVTPAYRADASVDLVIDGETYRYIVECKTNVDRKTQIDQAEMNLRQSGGHHLLVTEYVSKELAAYCRTVGLQFIDTHGNAYLRAPGLLVYTTGERNERRNVSSKAPKGLTNQGALRVIFAFLSKPALLSATFKEIAAISGVAVGTAYNVMEDLERRGYLIAGKKHSRKLLELNRLVDEWAINFPSTLRPKLTSRRFSAADAYWWEHIDISDLPIAWGSEVAAAKMFKHLKPSTQTLYLEPLAMRELINTMVKRARLRADPNGPIEMLERFWSPAIESTPGLAPPLLVYSDLLTLLDPRAKETANMIKEKFIEPTIDPS